MAAKKKEGASAPLAPTQLERVNAAIARLPRFDKFWLERLGEILAEQPKETFDRTLAETLLKRAKDWNLLRAHPSFPKSFVGE